MVVMKFNMHLISRALNLCARFYVVTESKPLYPYLVPRSRCGTSQHSPQHLITICIRPVATLLTSIGHNDFPYYTYPTKRTLYTTQTQQTVP